MSGNLEGGNPFQVASLLSLSLSPSFEGSYTNQMARPVQLCMVATKDGKTLGLWIDWHFKPPPVGWFLFLYAIPWQFPKTLGLSESKTRN